MFTEAMILTCASTLLFAVAITVATATAAGIAEVTATGNHRLPSIINNSAGNFLLPDNKAKRRRKRVKIPTPDSLSNIALYYLSRFAASEASLRRVLQNRIRRAQMAHPDFAADKSKQESLARAIDKIVDDHKKTGVLNDEAYAAMKVSSLRSKGRGNRRIALRLKQKGIAGDIVEAALKPGDGEEDAERKAALTFARKRKLGPYRPPAQNPDKKLEVAQKRKDIAALSRAGFGYDIVKEILGSEVTEDEFSP